MTADVSLVEPAPLQAIPADLVRAAPVRPAGVRLVAGSLAIGVLLLSVPSTALALPAGAAAPVVEVRGSVVAFYAGTAEVDGSTTLEPTTTGSKSRLDCTILFGKDSDVLRPGAAERLRRLAHQLHAQGAGRIGVTGYTDDLGSAAHGLDLSARRAHRVAHELRRVLPDQQFPLEVRGLGEAHPAVPNTSEANRRKNRRVVVTLTRTPATPAPKPAAPEPTDPVPTTPVPTSGPTTDPTPTPSRSATPTPSATWTAATGPPLVPPTSAPQPDSHMPPWPWIGGAAAALVGLGALADRLRRRIRTPDEPKAAADPESGLATGAGAAPTPPPGPATSQATAGTLRPKGATAASLTTVLAPPPFAAEAPESPAGPSAPDRSELVTGREGSAVEVRLEAALAADLAAWESGDTHRPRLSVLGPVHLRTRGRALARRRPFYTELFAYLALRPGGATVDEIADAFSLTPARVRTDMKILRDWLGVDPDTGTAYLPDARTTPAALRRGVAVYQLDGTLCDWHLFTRLQAAARRKNDAARASDLQTALNLVTGRPFDHARPTGWRWLFEGDRVDLHAAAAVVDVAVELIGYHRAHQDAAAAHHALQTLANIDPDKAHETMKGATR